MIGTGERSQFGEVFKMMRAEEVRARGGFGLLVSWGLRNEGHVVNASMLFKN